MKKKSTWSVILALLLILIGVLALLNSLEILSFRYTLGRLWPVILILLGIWLLAGRRHLHEEMTVYVQQGKKHSKAFGDLKIDASGMDPHGMDVQMGFGDLDVNLAGADFSARETVVNLALGFGDMKVCLPSQVKASILASCGAGEVEVLGKKEGGLGNKVEHQDEGYDTAPKKLRIVAKLGFGDMRIWRS